MGSLQCSPKSFDGGDCGSYLPSPYEPNPCYWPFGPQMAKFHWFLALFWQLAHCNHPRRVIHKESWLNKNCASQDSSKYNVLLEQLFVHGCVFARWRHAVVRSPDRRSEYQCWPRHGTIQHPVLPSLHLCTVSVQSVSDIIAVPSNIQYYLHST